MSKILLVDDEKNILEAYKRNLINDFDVWTADSGALALEILEKEKPFQVIVSDFKMPRMNGVQLLERAKIISPETVQIMITGQADIEAVIELINKGKIFRFLTKPCSTEDLFSNIKDAVRQYELITAEKELLGKTLGGSIKVLTDLLALAKPLAFNKTQRIRNLSRNIYSELEIDHKWQIEIAATLSQIGCVTLPDDILKKVYKGLVLSEDENFMFSNHPVVASEMIKNIPRMEKIAEIIRYQEKNYDGTGFPADDIREDKIPVGARILKVALDFDKAVSGGEDPVKVLLDMKKRTGCYDPEILAIAERKFLQSGNTSRRFVARELLVEELQEGMYLAEDLVSASGVIIGSKNQKITSALITTIKNYSRNHQLREKIKIIELVS